MGRLVLVGVLSILFFGVRFVFNLGRRRLKSKNLEGLRRCPECGAEISGDPLHCPSCGFSLQVERAIWSIAAWVPLLAVILLYLVINRYLKLG